MHPIPRMAINALAFLAFLAVVRGAVCVSMPDSIGGAQVWSSDIVVGLLGLPYVCGGLYVIVKKGWQRVGMILISLGLYHLSGMSMFRTQISIFHLGREFPLIDDLLSRVDLWAGLDWKAYFLWMTSNDLLMPVLSFAYQSIWFQPLLLSALFIYTNNLRQYTSMHVALPLSFALTCAIATFMPALGAYQYHGMSPDQHLGALVEFTDQMTGPLMWLRQETLPENLPAFADWRLITFPSWHAAAAIIFIHAAWPLERLRYVFLVLNVMMLVVTPVQGSHYFSDVIVGAAIGVIASLTAGKIICFDPQGMIVRARQGKPGAQCA